MAWVPFDSFKLRQFNGNAIDFDTDTIKVMLVTVAWVPDQTNHDFKNDVTNEVTGSNYTAGGNVVTPTLSVVAHVLGFDVLDADLTWAQHATGFTTARYAVMYKSTGSDATSALIAYYDLGADKGNVSGDLVLQSPSKIFTV